MKQGGHGGRARYILKDALKFLPLYGWYLGRVSGVLHEENWEGGGWRGRGGRGGREKREGGKRRGSKKGRKRGGVDRSREGICRICNCYIYVSTAWWYLCKTR